MDIKVVNKVLILSLYFHTDIVLYGSSTHDLCPCNPPRYVASLCPIVIFSCGFTGELGGAGAPPPNLLCPTPWHYAWTIQNFINVLILELGHVRAT